MSGGRIGGLNYHFSRGQVGLWKCWVGKSDSMIPPMTAREGPRENHRVRTISRLGRHRATFVGSREQGHSRFNIRLSRGSQIFAEHRALLADTIDRRNLSTAFASRSVHALSYASLLSLRLPMFLKS
jgi:hypothetical protein